MTRIDRAERFFLSFFGTPTDGTSASLFRITLGVCALWQAVGVWLNLRRFWGDDGLIPYGIIAGEKYQWLSPFAWAPSSDAVLYGHGIAFTAASFFLLIGFYPRVFTLVLAWTHLSLQLRNPFILNSGDRLFMIVAALAVAAPLGQRWSVDAWIRKLKNRPAPEGLTLWGMRLLQIQIAYVYLNSALAKLGNTRWRTGMALRDVLSSPVFAEWPSYIDVTPIIWFLTYSTLVFELSFPILIWFKKPRPWLLAYGVLFHAGIDALMVIPIFSYIMISTYPVFLEDGEIERARRFVLRILRRERAEPMETPSAAGV